MSAITLCGSFSLYPVGLGAAMHNAGYRALGLPFTYVPFAVTELTEAVRAIRALGIRGVGISMPYKQAIGPLLDKLDPMAARMGAVNTVVNDAGVLTGYNTDAKGALRAIEELQPVRGSRVLVLGAGGAARAIAHGLCEAGATVTIANRTQAKAETLARELSLEVVRLSPDLDLTGYDILLNATSVGMKEVEGTPLLPPDRIEPRHLVMDAVYKPIRTELLKGAEAQGARVVHGGRMLLYQAAAQFELYTGRKAPLNEMNGALEEQLGIEQPLPPSPRFA